MSWKPTARILVTGVVAVIVAATAWVLVGLLHEHRSVTALKPVGDLRGRVIRDWQVDEFGKYILNAQPPGQSILSAFPGNDPDLDLNLVWGISFLNPQLKDEDLLCLQAFPNLRGLGLNETAVSNGGLRYLRNFPNLQYLTLRGTGISDEGIVHLLVLKQLRYIDLRDTQVTDQGVERLQNAFPQLSISGPWEAGEQDSP